MSQIPSVRRAFSINEVVAIQGNIFPVEEVVSSIESYQPQTGDVVISPFAKCGTTWLQQCIHCLRSGGETEFDDISRVVPWIETARALEIDLSDSQNASPRAFKSHLPFDLLPHGPRFVVAFRDPVDAMVSHYRFMEGWFFDAGDIAIENFVLTQLKSWPYWHHLRSWWDQRNNSDVLLLSFAQMTEEPRPAIGRIASFCGIKPDPELIELTIERTSLKYMQAHSEQFDERLVRELAERRGPLPPGGNSSRVRPGSADRSRTGLPASYAEAIGELWRLEIAPHCGFASYVEFDAELRRRAEG